MLAKLIENHIDKMDLIEEQVDASIEQVYQSIDIDAILKNPDAELFDFVDIVKTILISKYAEEAIAEGVRLAKEIKGKHIKIQDSNDPNLNEDDKSKDNRQD